MTKRYWSPPYLSRMAAALACLAFEGLLLLDPWSDLTLTVVDDGLLAVAGLLASAACWRRGHRRAGNERAAWTLLSAGCGTFGLAQAGFALQAVFGHFPAAASPADALNIVSLPLAAWGLVRFARTSSLTSSLVTTLDGLIIAMCCVFVGWAAFLGPVYHAGTISRLGQTVTLVYITGTLTLTALVVVLAMRWQGDLQAVWLLASAFVWISVSSAAFAVTTLRGTYRTGDTRIDIGFFAPFLLIALAAQRPAGVASADALRRRSLLSPLVPYASLFIVVITASVLEITHADLGLFLPLAGATVLGLVLARQVITLFAYRALTLDLEHQVQERSAAARAGEAELEALLRYSADVIAVVDDQGALTYASPAASTMLGYETKDVLGQPVLDLVHPGDSWTVEQVLQGVLAGEAMAGGLECRVAGHDGEWCPIEMNVSPLRRETQTSGLQPGRQRASGLVLNIRDIRDRAAMQEELRRQALHDPLTHLPNRSLFQERLQHALDRSARSSEPISVLYIDLDHFKAVNDTGGHAAGDELLIEVGHRLRSSVRPEDTAARLGGDEFAVLLEDTASAGAFEIAQRIGGALAEGYVIGNRRHAVTASIGICTTERAVGDRDTLLRDADNAMYQAKRQGRSRICQFQPRPTVSQAAP